MGAGRTQRRQRGGRPERPGEEPRVEHGDLCAGVGDAIAMAVGHAGDEAVEPEAAEIVGHGARPIGGRIAPLELRHVIADIPMAESGGGEREETEGVHQGVDARVAEPEAGGALVVDEDGGRDGVECVFADQTIVAQ